MCSPKVKCEMCGKMSSQHKMILGTFEHRGGLKEDKLICPKCYKIVSPTIHRKE